MQTKPANLADGSASCGSNLIGTKSGVQGRSALPGVWGCPHFSFYKPERSSASPMRGVEPAKSQC
jgi:hypothetical protein